MILSKHKELDKFKNPKLPFLLISRSLTCGSCNVKLKHAYCAVCVYNRHAMTNAKVHNITAEFWVLLRVPSWLRRAGLQLSSPPKLLGC